MRLFVGLLPPQPVCDELVHALEPHREGWPQLRWLNPADWHVTLSFLGKVPDRVLPELETRLARAASRHAPMTLALAGAGAFPSASRARVFLVGVRGGGLRLLRLADSLGAGARRAGAVQTDHRRLRPHMSLARCRTGTDVRPLIEAFEPFSGLEWEAGTVHLVRSSLGAEVRYETIAQWRLGARTSHGQS
jgi:2'-5' RNA ligase